MVSCFHFLKHKQVCFFVIASQRVGAERRPMTGSTKQSIKAAKQDWIASSLRSSQ